MTLREWLDSPEVTIGEWTTPQHGYVTFPGSLMNGRGAIINFMTDNDLGGRGKGTCWAVLKEDISDIHCPMRADLYFHDMNILAESAAIRLTQWLDGISSLVDLMRSKGRP